MYYDRLEDHIVVIQKNHSHCFKATTIVCSGIAHLQEDLNKLPFDERINWLEKLKKAQRVIYNVVVADGL